MKPYKHTNAQDDALLRYLDSYYDTKCYLYEEYYAVWDELEEAVEQNDTEWIEKHTKELELINNKIKAIYKAAETLEKAFKD